MSQQKKIIYISEENYNILWHNGAKDGSFPKNGVTYYYDEDATYYVPAPNGGNSEGGSVDLTDYNGDVCLYSGDSKFSIDPDSVVIEGKNVNIALGEESGGSPASFSVTNGSWPVFSTTSGEQGGEAKVSMFVSDLHITAQGWNNSGIRTFGPFTINGDPLILGDAEYPKYATVEI